MVVKDTIRAAELLEEIRLRGWDRKPTGRVVFELGVNLALALGGIAIFIVCENIVLRASAIVVSTAGSLGVGTNTHTSSHYATSNKRWVNELLTYFGCAFYLGLSVTYWWHKHIVHHTAPNVIGVDKDADLSPWFALTREEVNRSRGLRRLYYERLQLLALPMALAANAFSMQKAGWGYLIRMLRDGKKRRKAHWIDLAALLLHFVVAVGIPVFYFATTHVLAFYMLRFGLLGYALFAVFGPGHLPAEATWIHKDHRTSDHFLRQTATTLNFRVGFLGRLLCSGLEYQIEHHLFPNVNHVYYAEMSPTIAKFCRENGLPYRSYHWGEALKKSLRIFRTPQGIQPSLEALRFQNQPVHSLAEDGKAEDTSFNL